MSDSKHPIHAYHRQRLSEVGLTAKTNKREVTNDGRPQEIPIFCADEKKDALSIPYVTPMGEIEAYTEGKKLLPFERLRYREPKEKKDADGRVHRIRYSQPPATGVRSYCPPAICHKYRKGEKIRTLIVVEGEFKAIAGSVFGLDIMGIGGIHNFKAKERNEMEENLSAVIRKCEVRNVILLFDADCLKAEYRNESEDMARRLQSFHAAVMRFHELLIPFQTEFYFAHIQAKYMLTARGLDDLLATPFIREDKEARSQLKHEFDQLSTGVKKYISIMHVTAASEDRLKKYFLLDSVKEFYEANKEEIQDRLFTYQKSQYYFDGTKTVNAFTLEARQYLRIGTAYYKQTWRVNSHKDPQFRKPELVLEPWQIGEINRDYNNNKAFVTYIPKYDRFCNHPDNTSDYKRIVEIEHEGIVSRSYNMYRKLDQEIKEGEWPNTEKLLRHIFHSRNTLGESLYEFGLDYIQMCWLKPTQRLPVLCPVSVERNTGKSSFLNFLHLIFKDNMSILDNERFTGKFTSHFVHKLIVALDEGFIPMEKTLMKERIKNFSTGNTVWLEGKGTNAVEVENFIHLIMCSNNETNFMQIDDGENRFAVFKVPVLEDDDPRIIRKIEEEIPAFLHYISSRKLYYEENRSRFSFAPQVYETEELKAVQERMQDFIPKTVKDYLRDLFMASKEEYLYLSAIDLMDGIRRTSDDRVKKPALMSYLKYDLKMKQEGYKRYTAYALNEINEEGYTTKSKPGYPYRFYRDDYLSPEDMEIMQTSALPDETSIKHNKEELPF
jgi:hypothetical protein